jgi:DNA segregation ATPase FtsK/SpoIIIE, S-DNA-T family
MSKRKSRQLTFNFGDERVPKLMGMLLVLFSFYLVIAITSYLFTWDNDHDIVFRYSFDLLVSDIQVDNWLGRLGAIVSDFLVYWCFGLASYVIAVILYKLGIALIRRASLSDVQRVISRHFLWMVVLSIVLGFLFQTFGFPWGGVFGQSISQYIQNFLGILGTVALMVFGLLGLFVWQNNPNLDEFSWLKFKFELRRAFDDLISGQYGKRSSEDLDEPRIVTRKSKKEHLDQDETDGFETILYDESNVELGLNSAPSANATDLTLSTAMLATAASQGGNEPIDLLKKSTLFSEEVLDEMYQGNASLEINEPVVPEPAGHPDESDLLKPPTVLVQEDSEFANSEPYDPTRDLSHYEYPHSQLLAEYNNGVLEVDREELEENKNQIVQTLLNFKIEIEKIRATIGPTVTLYEIIPARGVRISKIKNLEDDIALSLSALGIRIIAPIPGKGTIGIEVPNKNRQTVGFKELITSDKFKRAKMDIPIALGKTISNEVFVADLARMPHLLIAGATGQGKSVGINVILASILYKKHPSQIKLVLVDPKKVELFPYAHLENHFLAFLPDQTEPIVTDTSKVVQTLNSLIIEMETRYDLLKMAEVRNINEYNEKFQARRLNPLKGHKYLPFIVVVIDEFADLIMTAGKEIELPIGRLAQLARAVGIHMIIATQRPSVNIITGVIKANFPARLAFKVASKVDSRTILDAGGAEQLTGRGDMLLSVGGDIIRLQSAFVDTPETERVIDFIAKQTGFPEPFFLPEFLGGDETGPTKSFSLAELDDLFEDASRLVVETQHGSTSMIQRRMKLGYNRAGRIMDQLEALGIVGPADGSKPREVLYFTMDELNRYLTELRIKRFGG